MGKIKFMHTFLVHFNIQQFLTFCRNTSQEEYAKGSHVSCEEHILQNSDKWIR